MLVHLWWPHNGLWLQKIKILGGSLIHNQVLHQRSTGNSNDRGTWYIIQLQSEDARESGAKHGTNCRAFNIGLVHQDSISNLGQRCLLSILCSDSNPFKT